MKYLLDSWDGHPPAKSLQEGSHDFSLKLQVNQSRLRWGPTSVNKIYFVLGNLEEGQAP